MNKYAWILIILGILELVVGSLLLAQYFFPPMNNQKLVLPSIAPIPTEISPSAATPTNGPISSSSATLYPSQILDLTNWKLTLPTGKVESPTEIKQPALKTYNIDPWFTSVGRGVRFRAPVNGVSTSGSGYPRSELREMVSNGAEKASWSSTQGTHTMFLDQAITAVPKTKPDVVAGQIHDADDDVLVIRLEFPKLYVNVDGENVVTLDENYALGKRFTVRFVANNGKTSIYYNGNATPNHVLDKSYSGAYFKTGAYTQSNCEKEKSTALCTSDNFGEVILYKVLVTHQ